MPTLEALETTNDSIILDPDRAMQESYGLAWLGGLGVVAEGIDLDFRNQSGDAIVNMEGEDFTGEVCLAIADRTGLLLSVVQADGIPERLHDDRRNSRSYLLVHGEHMQPTGRGLVTERRAPGEVHADYPNLRAVLPLLLRRERLTDHAGITDVSLVDRQRVRQEVGLIAGSAALRLLSDDVEVGFVSVMDEPLVSIDGLDLPGSVQLVAAGRSGLVAAVLESPKGGGAVFTLVDGSIQPLDKVAIRPGGEIPKSAVTGALDAMAVLLA